MKFCMVLLHTYVEGSLSQIFCLGPSFYLMLFRDWSLITGRGGATKREGGHVKFYPYEKGRRKKFRCSFYTVA